MGKLNDSKPGRVISDTYDKEYPLSKKIRQVLRQYRIRILDSQYEKIIELWKRKAAKGQVPDCGEVRGTLIPKMSAKMYHALVDNARPYEFNNLTDDDLNAVLHDILRTTLTQKELTTKHGWVKLFSENLVYDDYLQDYEHIGKDEGGKLAYRLMRSVFDYFRQRWLSLDGFEYYGNETQAKVFDEKINHRKSPKQINRKHGFSYQLINKALGELENKLRL